MNNLHDRLVIVKTKKDWIVKNELGDYSHHAHLKSSKICKKLINLIERKIVPDSDYLRGSVLRLTLDRKYKQKVADKIRKDANKQSYYNINKGV